MSKRKDDETHLVNRARRGDQEAFWSLVERHGPMVHRLLRRLVKDRERAEDLFSETFLKAADHIEKFRGEAKFSTWLVSIAVNLSRNELKRDRRRQHISWDEVIPTESHSHGPGAPSLAEWANPHEVLEQKELRELLDRGIESLPSAYRVVFALRDIEGLSTAETARALGLTETAVKSRAARARLALRKFLTPHLRSPAREQPRA
jgi:RNA polymerase sigma-70 factor (ECF subfamily)